MRRFESRKLLNAARGRSCVLCGIQDETVVAAHLPGSHYRMAAGMGQKTHDWLAGHLCLSCHSSMDTCWRKNDNMRLMALCLTLERLFAEGILRVE